MPIPTTAWDETSPSGSQSISLGDNRIRELKGQVREVIEVDHEMDASGNGDDWGKHNKVSLLEQADIGSGATGKPILGAQTADSKAELFFTNEDDVDIQLTKGTKINSLALDLTLTSLAGLMALIYPVGSVYINAGVATNPATLFGFGTWIAYGPGKVIVGLDAGGDTDFDDLADTGGAKTVTLTAAQSGVPAHTHTSPLYSPNAGGNSGVPQNTPGGADTTSNPSNANAAADAAQAHQNMPPYVVAYMWKRTV